MNFIKRRFSLNSDPDKDREDQSEKSVGSGNGNILDSLSTKRSTMWNDFTSRIRSDKASPNGTEASGDDKTSARSFTFMDSVKQKLNSVRQQYDKASLRSDGAASTEVECAPLVDTTLVDDLSDCASSDKATFGESLANDAPVHDSAPIPARKKLGKRQDSFTAEEVYLDTVAAKVKAGLTPPDSKTTLISPSTAVQEFSFSEASNQKKPSAKATNQKRSNGKRTLLVPDSNLINFDSMQNLSSAAVCGAEIIVHREDDSVLDYESSGDESSEPIYSEFARRSDSLNSLDSTGSSIYDEEAQALRDFATNFVENIFSDGTNTSEDKAKFGRCVRDGSFRLHFARSISEKRVESKAVTEHTFYQLVQYFAVVLFECQEADDFSPAMILMNMCFTFYYEGIRAGQSEKYYLSTYLRNQPIWQSMRYWNASFYEAVQQERMHKPLTTNDTGDLVGGGDTQPVTTPPAGPDTANGEGKDSTEEETEDRIFQENIIFGQLGTFLHNMRAFGLDLEWCLEFLRKQAVIGNLNDEQTAMLRECVEMDQFAPLS